MSHIITCPTCSKRSPVPTHWVGKRIKCECGQTWVVPQPEGWLDSAVLLWVSIVLLLGSMAFGGLVIAWEPLGRPSDPLPKVAATSPEKSTRKGQEDPPKARTKQTPANPAPTPPRTPVQNPPVVPAPTPSPMPMNPIPPVGTPIAGRERGVRYTDEELYERLLSSVVWIYAQDEEGAWTGSGGVVHVGQRLIVTNWHVAGSVFQVFVVFPRRGRDGKVIHDKRSYRELLRKGEGLKGFVLAKGKSKERDLAIIQLQDELPPGTRAIKVAPNSARPGQRLTSVGNPGVSSALWVVSTGQVRSRVENTLKLSEDQTFSAMSLETTLPINQGDSGSPIVNDRGHLVGVNFAYKGSKNLMVYASDRDNVLTMFRAVGVKEDEMLASETLPPTTEVVQALRKKIQDPDRTVSLEGVRGLSRVERQEARRLVPDLIQAMQRHADDAYRRTATEELDRIGPPVKQDLACLDLVIQMPYKPARLYALEALAQLGAEAKFAASVLVQGLKDKDKEIRVKAATVLKHLGARVRPQAFQALLASSDDADEEVALAAIEALINLGPLTAGEIDLLIEALEDDQRRVWVRRFAAYRLGEQGKLASKAVPVLLRVLTRETDSNLLSFALLALKRIGDKRKEVLTTLLDLVSSDSPEKLRMAALDALVTLDLSIFSTEKMLDHIEREKNSTIRNKLAQLLGVRLGSLNPEEMVELRPLLTHKDPDFVMLALNIIHKKETGKGLEQYLAGLVTHSDAGIRHKASTALELLGIAAQPALPKLLQSLPKVPSSQRSRLALTIAIIEPKDPEVVEQVLPFVLRGLHPEMLGEHGRSTQAAIHRTLQTIGQPAVDAIFTCFGNISYRGRDNINYRKHLFVALEYLAPDCRNKANYDRVRSLRDREIQEGYRDVVQAAQRALGKLDPR